MYLSACPALDPAYFLRSHVPGEVPFPLNAPRRTYFYRARNAIYHLFHALKFHRGETVLVPDYHSGNEVWAIRAAGAAVRFYHIGRNLEPDLEELTQLCKATKARALFIIHYLGWPQPMKELTALCQERGMILIEDCALAFLSETDGQPLGTFGDYAIFCLYKTVPVPNGGLLVQNRHVFEDLARLNLKPCGMVSLAGSTAELMLEWIRSRSDGFGKALSGLKSAVGKALSTLHVKRVPVGDIGFSLAHADIGMSPLCNVLLTRFDYEGIRWRRRENFLLLRERLAGTATLLFRELPEGVCPLFFPILVPDKQSAAQALWQRGIAAVQFWNFGDAGARGEGFSDAQFLRDHVLELPIHQNITQSQMEYVAEQVLSLKLHF